MQKIVINMIDENVAHAGSFSEANLICGGGSPRHPKKVNYVWNQKVWDGISVFTDKRLHAVDQVKAPVKVAWLMEPRAYDPSAYNLIIELEDYFHLVLTHDTELLNRDPKKYAYLPADTNIIEDCSIAIHEKSKLTSFIYSQKQFLEGHKMRFSIAQFLNEKNFDVESFGHGCNPIEKKAAALKDYCFSIAVENSSADNYFTDKILDCFVTGTVPIYWGCPNVFDYFNKDGILYFTTLEELEVIMNSLSIEKYKQLEAVIAENFEKAQYYMRLDDIVLDTILSKLNIKFALES
jgi:hypothetical protein